MRPETQLILASASPRRKSLLEQIGYSFRVIPSHVDEPPFEDDDPAGYASNLATLKAGEISNQYPDALVIGADTIVIIGNEVLGKPENDASAYRMLSQLSGQNHQVITAYSFHLKASNIKEVHHVLTQVHFKKLRPEEINYYIETRAPFDKAGAYGIQDYSSVFVDRIQGCFYNVVGLPLSDFNEKLNNLLRHYSITLK
ncbi:MAG: septum formation protein Maf [Candidatus Marinimicrobia bacterium]|nr:septum formation protein Maf [FCB group bacterium]MBL7024995.1 septum formation protein Maf [Candidatus Neomarinimicrobiota bacterium]